MNRVLAKCPKTRRVLVSGPDVHPAVLKWVTVGVHHRAYPGFVGSVSAPTEKEAYELVFRDYFESRIEADPYGD